MSLPVSGALGVIGVSGTASLTQITKRNEKFTGKNIIDSLEVSQKEAIIT
jgi:hypothetical protein